MARLINLVITPGHDTASRTTTWRHAMTTTSPRSDDINHPTTGATKANTPRIEIGTGTIVITVGGDTK